MVFLTLTGLLLLLVPALAPAADLASLASLSDKEITERCRASSRAPGVNCQKNYERQRAAARNYLGETGTTAKNLGTATCTGAQAECIGNTRKLTARAAASEDTTARKAEALSNGAKTATREAEEKYRRFSADQAALDRYRSTDPNGYRQISGKQQATIPAAPSSGIAPSGERTQQTISGTLVYKQGTPELVVPHHTNLESATIPSWAAPVYASDPRLSSGSEGLPNTNPATGGRSPASPANTTVDARNGGASTLGQYHSVVGNLADEQKRARDWFRQVDAEANREAGQHSTAASSYRDQEKKLAALLPSVSSLPNDSALAKNAPKNQTPEIAAAGTELPASQSGIAEKSAEENEGSFGGGSLFWGGRGKKSARGEGSDISGRSSETKEEGRKSATLAAKKKIQLDSLRGSLHDRLMAEQQANDSADEGTGASRVPASLVEAGLEQNLETAKEELRKRGFSLSGAETEEEIRRMIAELEADEQAGILGGNSLDLFSRVRETIDRAEKAELVKAKK